MSNPFSSPPSKPGQGTIHLALLPPSTPRLRTVKYQYPLKLVAPAPLRTEGDAPQLVHTVYVLSYGGGIVAGDCLSLRVVLETATRLILLTQGSTKLFRSPSSDILSRQTVTAELAPGSALCYLPDPVQPFAQSSFEQQQVYNVVLPQPSASSGTGASLCVLDWVSSGRPANGEDWSFYHYASLNEIFVVSTEGGRRLLLRDSLVLDHAGAEGSIARRMAGLPVYGTLILYGPMFSRLGTFFMEEFAALPRIGARKWDAGSDDETAEIDATAMGRAVRHRQEAEDGVLWSVASLRGCVVVKLGASKVEHGRRWLLTMLSQEGSVKDQFGERALLCLK